MKIGVIGYYNHGNIGDDRILECLSRSLDGHELVIANDLDNAFRRLDALNACDFVLLGGGGLVLRGTNRYAELVERLTPRFGCVGLGVEDRHEDNALFIEALKEKSEFILVRDVESRELLDRHFKVIVGPDLSFLYPFQPAETLGKGCGLNLRPWHWWKCSYRDDEYFRMLDAVDRDPSLRGDWREGSWDPAMVVETLRRRYSVVTPVSFWAETGCPGDRDVLGEYFPMVEERSDVARIYRRLGRLVAMRFHALVFACQMGIPFVSLSYQPKCERFCRSLGMEEASVDVYDLASLEPALDALEAGYDQRRERLLDASADSHREITYIMDKVLGLVRTPRAPKTTAGVIAEMLHRAETLSESGDLDGAVEEVRRALEMDPSHAVAWNDLGVLLFAAGEPHASVIAFTQSLTFAPDYVLAISNLADVKAALGDPEGARGLYESAIRIDPAHRHAAEALAGLIA